MSAKIKEYLSYTLSALLLTVFCILNYVLFYNQCASALISSDRFESDVLLYIFKAAGAVVPYDFPYPLFFKLINLLNILFSTENATSLTVTILNTLSVIILAYFLKHYLKCRLPKSVFISLCLHFVSMIFLPVSLSSIGLPLRYLGVFSPNPWQNATYIATRPFSIGAFFIFAGIMEKEETIIKDYIIFGIFMLLTTLTKPSFTLPMIGVCCIAWCMDFFKWHTEGRKKRTLLLILSLFPTVIDLLYQYRSVFTGGDPGSEKGMGIGLFTAWHSRCDNIPLAIILGSLCPLYMLIRYREKSRLYDLAWMLYLIALCTFSFIYEKGDRLTHLNFSWGYMHGMFFLYCISAIQIFGRKDVSKRNIPDYIAFGAHLLCGLIYFNYLYRGESFYYF